MSEFGLAHIRPVIDLMLSPLARNSRVWVELQEWAWVSDSEFISDTLF